MLYPFLMALKNPKKGCNEQLNFVLQKYGFMKQADKDQYVLCLLPSEKLAKTLFVVFIIENVYTW